MKYLLDTDVVSLLYDDQRKAHYETLHRKLSQLNNEDELHTSALVIFELEYSFFNAPDEKKAGIRNTINSVLSEFNAILPVTTALAPIFGELKAQLKHAKNLNRKDLPQYNIDLILASTAIHTSAVLVGNDHIYRELLALNERFAFENWLSC